MTIEIFVWFVWAIAAFMGVTLVALLVHGRRAVRRMDAEFAARRREEETQRGH